jgi:hypothetical protein
MILFQTIAPFVKERSHIMSVASDKITKLWSDIVHQSAREGQEACVAGVVATAVEAPAGRYCCRLSGWLIRR